MKDLVVTNEDKKLEAEEDLDQHCDISVEMEKFSEHIVENEEEVKDVVAINDDKNMKQKKILIINMSLYAFVKFYFICTYFI